MAKKMRLQPVPDTFTLIGIASHLKDYRLCFFLNKHMGSSFARMPDLIVPGDPEKTYSFYLFHNKEERRNYFLIANHHPEGKLLPGQKGLDYLLFIDDLLRPEKARELAAKIQSAPNVMASFLLDPSGVKNISALIEDIEMHLMSV